MAPYVFSFAGREHESWTETFGNIDEARNSAVRHLGQYLSTNPGFAEEGHWRVTVANTMGQPLLHVIVATVASKFAVAEGCVP